MLSAPVSENKTKEQQGKTQSEPETEGFRRLGGWVGYDSLSLARGRLSAPSQQAQQAAMQRAYGNQAVLRRMGRLIGNPVNTSSALSQRLQRKCACRNKAETYTECHKQKARSKADLMSSWEMHPVKVPSRATFQIPFAADISEDPDSELALQQFIQPPPSSGTCQNGGGVSRCWPNSGVYLIERNDNDCCTRPCTQEHEQQHVIDHDRWGCCKAFSIAWNKPGANPQALKQLWETWASQANLATECNAYTNDVACARRLAVTKGCAQFGGSKAKSPELLASTDGTDTSDEIAVSEAPVTDSEITAQQVASNDFPRPIGLLKDIDNCCLDIAGYEEEYSKYAESYCAQAPKQVPPCPFITQPGGKKPNKP